MDALTVSHPRFERRYYLGATCAFLALVFAVFAPSYYLKHFFGTPALSTRLQIHGAVMTGWILLLVVQSTLVATRRLRWHRQIGGVGSAWALLVVVVGATTTMHAAAREVQGHTDLASVKVSIMGLELLQMLLFGALVGCAIWMRRRPDYHKRLMLLTIGCMLPSAIGRLPSSFIDNQTILLSLNVFVLVCVGIDTLRHRRLHPANGWAAGLLLLVMNLGFYFAMRPGWISLGTAFVS